MKKSHLIFLASLGGALELYDFVIFAFLAPILGQLFFPAKDPLASLLNIFIVFAIGYLARPLGGLLFGHVGDKKGRKNTFIMTIVLMAIPTFLIGLIPTYQTIGIAAPLILCLLRILQGFAMAGEVPGSIVFLTETMPDTRGFASGFIFFALNLGMLAGSLLITILTTKLSSLSLMSWGWRIPFLLGGTLGIVCYFLRKKIQETPLFFQLFLRNSQAQKPLCDVMKSYSLPLLQAFCLTILGAAFFSYFFYLPSYFIVSLGYPKAIILLMNSLSIFVFSCSALIVAIASDYISRKKILLLGCIGFLVFSFPLFQWFQGAFNYTHILIGCMIFSIIGGFVSGTFPCLLAEMFPTTVRYSGFAIAYNIGFALAGGLTPTIVIFFVKNFHYLLFPAYYLMGIAAICLCATLSIKKLYL